MNIDLSRFRVVYKENVLNAITLLNFEMKEDTDLDKQTVGKPKFLVVMALNSDGNIEIINDEAWMFQFIPIVTK